MKIHRLLLILIFGLFLYGDVMYEMLTTTEGMMGMGSSEATIRVFIKGDYSRTETTAKSPMTGEITSTTITRLDKKLVWILNDENKEYSELDLPSKIEPAEVADTSILGLMPEIKVERSGEKKKILEKECEKIIVTMNIKSEDEQGNIGMTQTMWVSRNIPGLKEINAFNKKLTEFTGGISQSAMMGINKKSMDEFQKKIGEIEGFPLELELNMTMGNGMTIKTYSTVTNISIVPISQKVFEIPEGYVPSEH